jgi:hypothetical protein
MKDLPAELVAYHRSGQPIEGDLGEGFPGWFQLWPLDQIEELNRAYEVGLEAPGFMGVGSNGGGEMIALSPSGQVVVIPFLDMKPADATVVAQSWGEFETLIKSKRA